MVILNRYLPGRSDKFRGGLPAPDQPFFAIGDVHGRLDLLNPLLDRLMSDSHPIILVGDYVDRGEDSAGVLQKLRHASQGGQVICLRGNHEEMMLKFIARPKKNGRIWLRFGGLQTLASFGIGGLTEQAGPDQLIAARDALCVALGDTLGWLQELPYLWQSGNVAVVHAGADPHLPLDDQSHRALAWGHPDFATVPRQDGIWIIYGHVIVPTAQIENGHAAIDTGAYATGTLTSIKVETGAITPV